MTEHMALPYVLREWSTGDEWSWWDEFDWLQANHAGQLAALRKSIQSEGIREPVSLGSDGRVWDGHHRLCCAFDLGLPVVPARRLRPAETSSLSVSRTSVQ